MSSLALWLTKLTLYILGQFHINILKYGVRVPWKRPESIGALKESQEIEKGGREKLDWEVRQI